MIDKMEAIIYQTGVKQWKCILFDISEKNSRKLIADEELETRAQAEQFATDTENKLVYNIYPGELE